MIVRAGRLSRLLAAVGVLLVVTGCTPAPPDDARLAVGAERFVGGTTVPDPFGLPDLVLTDTSGQAYNLARTPSQPVTLLFFGYTHCPTSASRSSPTSRWPCAVWPRPSATRSRCCS